MNKNYNYLEVSARQSGKTYRCIQKAAQLLKETNLKVAVISTTKRLSSFLEKALSDLVDLSKFKDRVIFTSFRSMKDDLRGVDTKNLFRIMDDYPYKTGEDIGALVKDNIHVAICFDSNEK